MTTTRRMIFVAAAALYLIFPACKSKSKVTDGGVVTIKPKTICDTITPTYTADIKKILDTHCASDCHSAGNHADGVDLSSYEGAKSAAGYASFLGTVKHERAYPPMPKKEPKLGDADIQKLSCWVSNGLPR